MLQTQALNSFAHPRRSQLDALTSLRFFAAFYVVVFHFWSSYQLTESKPLLIGLGETGVTFFFLLSGFILSYSYDDDGEFPKGSHGRFYLARLVRIYPVYIATILIMFPALVFLRNTAPDQNFREIWALTSPLALHAWIPGAACSLNCPNWSISTEAFFYLLFPLAFAPVFRRPLLALVLAVMTMVAIWWMQIDDWVSTGRSLDAMKTASFASDQWGDLRMQLYTYFPLTRLPEFVIGIGLYALWKRGADQVAARTFYLATVLGAIVVVMTAHWVPENVMRTGWSALCYAPLVLAAANTNAGMLTMPALVWLGKISFALYLVHSPVDSYLRTIDKMTLGATLATMPVVFFCLATVIAFAAAAFLFHFVEEPARRLILASARRRAAT